LLELGVNPTSKFMACTEPQTALAEVQASPVSPLVAEIPLAKPALKKWLPILARFTFIQAVVQLLGFTAGILIVRQLPKREYAFYTIGNTMLSTILMLADSGISSALSAIGGRVWQDGRRLGSLMNTALQLRRQLAFLTVLFVVPVLVWLLRQNGAHLVETVLLVIAVLAGSGLELITRIYSVALRLKSQIRQIQNQALLAALVKLVIVGVAIFIFFNAIVAILSVVIGYAVQFWMLRRWTARNVDNDAPKDDGMRSEIISVIRKQSPHSIYFCLQGQITVWLISIFGSTDNVANVGALGRLAMLFMIVSSVSVEVILPAFSRIQSANQLRRRFFQIVLGYFAMSTLLMCVIIAFPRQILSVLGSQYANLQSEGILMAASAIVAAIGGLLWTVNAARAWIVPPHILIPVTIVLQVVLVMILDLSTVRGVLLFSIYSGLPGIILSMWWAMRRMWELPVVSPASNYGV
jgi:O-antigen/teichoic acid export membrane protein